MHDFLHFSLHLLTPPLYFQFDLYLLEIMLKAFRSMEFKIIALLKFRRKYGELILKGTEHLSIHNIAASQRLLLTKFVAICLPIYDSPLLACGAP